MHNIKIKNRIYKIPSNWQECNLVHLRGYIHAQAWKDSANMLLQVWLLNQKELRGIRFEEAEIADLLKCVEWASSTPLLTHTFAKLHTQLAKISAENYALIEATLTEISNGTDTKSDLIGLLLQNPKDEVNLSESDTLILLKFCGDSVMQVRTDYALAFTSPLGAEHTTGADFGWIGVFMSIAESGVFGNLAQVKQTPVAEILTFMMRSTDHANRNYQIQQKYANK